MSFLRANATSIKLLAILSALSVLRATSYAQEPAVPVYGVHDIELGDGVDSKEFESYVIEKFVPAWQESKNGLRMLVLKGDRGERKGKYQLVYAFDSVDTRDKFFPPETQRPSDLYRQTVASVADVMQGLSKFNIQRKAFTDYSPVGSYTPSKPGSTPVIAVRNIELGDDVDAAKFEQFVKEEFAPAWKEPREGLQFVFTKGDRGERKDKFQFVWVFESIDTRNDYFPEEGGGGTGKLGEVVESAGDIKKKLKTFPFSSTQYTDYYPLNRHPDE